MLFIYISYIEEHEIILKVLLQCLQMWKISQYARDTKLGLHGVDTLANDSQTFKDFDGAIFRYKAFFNNIFFFSLTFCKNIANIDFFGFGFDMVLPICKKWKNRIIAIFVIRLS